MKSLILIFTIMVAAGGFYLLMANTSKKPMESTANHLRVNLSEGDPPSLHPHRSVDVRGRMIGKSLFEGLTRLNPQGKVELAAADKVEVDPTYTRYLFSIRPHCWSNGQAVTASHFEKAWKAALHPSTRCARADLFYLIKNAKKAKCGEVSLDAISVKALDAKTLVVELAQPAPYFLELISHPVFAPILDEEEPTAFNGPFVLGKWKHGSLFELERNPQYWDAENVKLQKVSFTMVADPHTEYYLFEKGEYDVMGDAFDSIPNDLFPAARKDPRFQTSNISRVYWLYTNTDTVPFNCASIRKAFAYAINRKNIVRDFLIDDIPMATILPKTLTLLDETEWIDDGNAKTAVRLFEQGLKELGLTKETFPKITISYCTYGSQKSLTQLFQESLSQTLGIDVEIQAFEWNVLSDNLIHGQFQLASCVRHTMYEDPFYFLEIFREKGSPYNSCRWENKTYQQLLAQANSTFDMKEREKYLRAAEKLLLDEMPVIPIYTETCKFILNEKLKGYSINRSGYVDLKPLFFEK